MLVLTVKCWSIRISASDARHACKPAHTVFRNSIPAVRPATTINRSLWSYQKRQPGKAERCTLCVHLTNEGQIPACVRACAVGALNFVDWDNLDEKIKPMAEKSVAMNEAAGTKPKVRYYASHMDIAKLADKMTH